MPILYRLPTVSALHDFLKGAGFNLGSTVNVTETIFREDHWLDKEGPFRQEWRNTDRYNGSSLYIQDFAIVYNIMYCELQQCMAWYPYSGAILIL